MTHGQIDLYESLFKRLTSSLFLIFLFSAGASNAQKTERSRELDSLYNDPFFYPTVSAVLLPSGFWEVNNFSSILSATRLFNQHGDKDDLNGRYTFFINSLQVNYGASKKGNFNIGLDLGYQRYRFDDLDSSPFSVFRGDSAIIKGENFNTLTLRTRWKPIRRLRNLILQGAVSQPIHNAASSQHSALARLIYVSQLSRTFFIYSQLGVSHSFKKKEANGSWSIPAAVIFQYQVVPSFGMVATVSHTPVLGRPGNNKFSQTSFGTQVGGGFQYQPSLRVGINTSYAHYILGKDTGAFGLLNLGFRLII